MPPPFKKRVVPGTKGSKNGSKMTSGAAPATVANTSVERRPTCKRKSNQLLGDLPSSEVESARKPPKKASKASKTKDGSQSSGAVAKTMMTAAMVLPVGNKQEPTKADLKALQ